ncbi:MAG: c-type cytochrome [Acidobacteria bacterium]|nr:c-type cytochrome [Acidobacteriota bacterium]
MAEKKSVGHAYNVDFLNVVFAASSLFLFLSVIWMVWDDFDRDWKNTQRRFALLQYQVTQAQLQQATRAVDRGKLQQLEAQEKAGQQVVAANQQKIDELQAKLDEMDVVLDRTTKEAQSAKAIYDQDRYDFEAARAAGDSGAAAKGERVAEEEKALDALNLQIEKLTSERAEAQKQLSQFTGQAETAGKAIEDMHAEERRLQKQLDVLAPSVLKDYFRNAPLLDFMAPTLKVQQLILPNVVDDVNFIRVPKMDRCQTCHLSIDRKGYEKYPQPFTTHSNLSSYIGSDSPHPIDKIGCTVCHEGMGQSVNFRDASHMPTGEKQQEEWEQQYGWEQPHLWDYPMLPTKLTEASCAKCHRQQVYVPKAASLNVAYGTFERAGCYACHKTRGFDTNIKKPGPILTKIDAKLSQDWVKTWIRNPKAVKETTWMPRFWYNSNNSAPEDATRNEVEINAISSYLFANGEKYEPAVKNPSRGDAKRGEEVVKSIGCQGCHVVAEGSRSDAGPHRTFGQPLENIGNKTTYEWLYNWVRDPKHYSPTTYMPNLRLTDQQVADVATYLFSLKGATGDAAKASPDQKAVNDVLVDYLYRGGLPFEDAKVAAAKMNGDEQQVELGRRAITRYGCFSCHDIKGFENAQSIGTDLSEEGSKLVTRLDFAFINDIPHTSKIEWFRRKLHDPRVFDKGRVLRPDEKLRMPNFDLSDVEVERLVTAIMSFQREIQPPAAYPVQSARYDHMQSGRTLVHRRNCVGCHIIEDSGGDFLKLVAEESLGPPRLTPEGARVQPDWLYAFLRSPITLRPWIDVRMPTFGLDDPNLNGVIRYFGALSNTVGPFQTIEAVKTSAAVGAGKEMFEQFQCQKCHVLGSVPKDQEPTTLAPDLRMSSDRLQPEWIVDWLKNPTVILPGTRMPVFWADYPKSQYPQLGGNADAQIRAIRDYLLTFRGGPSPRRPSSAVVTANN